MEIVFYFVGSSTWGKTQCAITPSLQRAAIYEYDYRDGCPLMAVLL